MQNREYGSGDLPPLREVGEPASPGARLAAVIIDFLIYMAAIITITAIVSLTFSEQLDEDDHLSSGVNAATNFANDEDDTTPLGVTASITFITVFAIQMVLLGTRGQTIGKIVLKIRIIDNDSGDHPGWVRLVLLRTVVNTLLLAIPFLGPIYGIVDSLYIFRNDRRTVHDLYSGTAVDQL